MKQIVTLLSALTVLLLGWSIIQRFVPQVEWTGLDFIGHRPFFLVIGMIVAALNLVHFISNSSSQTYNSLQFRNAIVAVFFLFRGIMNSIEYTKSASLTTALPQLTVITIITLTFILGFYFAFQQARTIKTS
jgi:hypothetical protein